MFNICIDTSTTNIKQNVDSSFYLSTSVLAMVCRIVDTNSNAEECAKDTLLDSQRRMNLCCGWYSSEYFR